MSSPWPLAPAAGILRNTTRLNIFGIGSSSIDLLRSIRSIRKIQIVGLLLQVVQTHDDVE